MNSTTHNTQANRKPRRLSGVVVSDKMKDTIVVEVTRYVKHLRYKKYRKITKRYKVHDAGNTKKVEEKVDIEECKPVSKDKRFKVKSP
ncbi:MAG: 30S ribosomal protein S17 [bacterium]|nr:30S ribosomal protein S17 [bacterium]